MEFDQGQGQSGCNLICQEQYGSSQKKHQFMVQNTDQTIRRIDVSARYSNLKQVFSSIFLPQGYPDSVSEDYLTYQVWDTVQAFASSITGTLAAHAVLRGVGVGDGTATVLGATMTWLLKDGASMSGRIVFAWMKSTGLDCDAKRWRLFADLLNDISIFLDILAPSFGNYFTAVVCISGVFRSIVGVAGGATRAALTQHQARRNNMADVSAKDGSQETLVNLMALACNLILVPLVSNHQHLIWALFAVFTFLHIFANYKAVTSVAMETINQTRLYFITQHYLQNEQVLNVKTINAMEPVIFPVKRCMDIKLGVSFSTISQSNVSYPVLKEVYDRSGTQYLLGIDFKRRTIKIVLSQASDSIDHLQACFHAEIINFIVESVETGKKLNKKLQNLGVLIEKALYSKPYNQEVLQACLKTSLDHCQTWMPDLHKKLHTQGWLTDTSLLAADEWRANWNFNCLIEKKVK